MDATLRKALIEREGKCELCGSRRGLEVHHIIPRVCGGEDSEENCIVVCCGCHGKLTPKGVLTKIGQRNVRWVSQRDEIAEKFYRKCNEVIEQQHSLEAMDMFEIFDEVVGIKRTVM